MPSITEAENALEAEAIKAAGATPLCLPNQDAEPFLTRNPQELFIRCRILTDRSHQRGLGDTGPKRVFGTLAFLVQSPLGIGAGAIRAVLDTLQDHFEGKTFNGVTLPRATMQPEGTNGNWSVRGIQFEFYFDKP